MESAQKTLDLIPLFAETVKKVLTAMENFGTTYDARSLESHVEEQCRALTAVIYETCWIIRMNDRPMPKSIACACGHLQHNKGSRPRQLRTVFGEISLEVRNYFYCDHCQASTYLGDELRGESNFSQLAEDRIAFMGKEGAFEPAADALKHLGIMAIAATTVKDVCNRLGQKLREKLDHEAALQHCPENVAEEEWLAGLGISVDGVMLGRVDTQHRKRGKTNRKVLGKTALKHFFHEVKTLVIFAFNQKGETLRKTYQATQARIEDFREMVALEAQKRGAQTAGLLAFLGDGAPWVWKTASELFPQAIQVLDWYHAMEHIWAVGRVRFDSREKEMWAWVTARETELWNGKVEAVIEALKNVSRELGEPSQSLSEAAKAADAKWIAYRCIGYFENNKDRVDYPAYRAKNLPIGSGVVESACKHVVASRMKRAGMRWDETGAENILALRCHYLNDRWDSLWAHTRAA